MVAIGFVPELTAEAAKRAALGAGARVIRVFCNELTNREMEEIRNLKLDIILLAGGTDGGNQKCILHNARKIADHGINVPVVVAGNKSAGDEIEEILGAAGIFYKVTNNVMPRLNVLNVEPAREVIRDIFMEKIVEAKGMNKAEEIIDGILMPTPAAVLKAAELLSKGTEDEDGIGDLVVVDIGGATTDVHSIADGEPTKPGVTLRGLEEPFAKRTVEGDLGMRYSAVALREACGKRRIKKYLADLDMDIVEECRLRTEDTEFLPRTAADVNFDEALAKTATEVAMERHVGVLESVYTPMGVVYAQTGKDLMDVKCLIGTGGVLVESDHAYGILKAGLYDTGNPDFLKPSHPRLLLDQSYILAAMGLFSEHHPDAAVRILKKYLVELNEEENHGA